MEIIQFISEAWLCQRRNQEKTIFPSTKRKMKVQQNFWDTSKAVLVVNFKLLVPTLKKWRRGEINGSIKQVTKFENTKATQIQTQSTGKTIIKSNINEIETIPRVNISKSCFFKKIKQN